MKVKEIFESMSYGPAPESDKAAREWLQGLSDGQTLFIGGAMGFAKSSTETFETHNPATGEKLGVLAQASGDDVDRAVTAARDAQAEWAGLSGHERAKYLYALARLVQKNSRILAVLETLDNGKPIRESRDIDVPLVARHFYHHAGWAQLRDEELPGHKPLGVIGQIIPWNFPLLMLAWKIAPAIAMGNTVVLKPAEYTSLTALYFAGLCVEAGLPNGVVNIITGDGDVGSALVGHADIDKIAFTGSTEVGRIIRKQLAGRDVELTLELGGKSPFIVFEDADIDGAVEGLVDGIWFNQGEVCCAGSRLLVQEGIEERLVEKLKVRLSAMRLGDPLDKSIDMGAIIDPVQKERIEGLVDQGVKEGAELWQPDIECPSEGCFYLPSLMLGVESSNVVAAEEIFGPVLAVMSFRTQDEAVALANNTRYGLAASVWSENINRALDVAPKLKAGVVWINSTNQFDASCGFGGYRESGFGREGGIEGLHAYLKPAIEATFKPAEMKIQAKAPAPANIDRTAKMYIGGKQARPDGGATLMINDPAGNAIERVGAGNRKDIRNAVEAAHKAESWSKSSGHLRAQIIYYIGENLSARSNEFAARLVQLGTDPKRADAEVKKSVERLFGYAAWADKYEGRVHEPPMRGITLAMNEPQGITGVICPNYAPLLSFITLMATHMAVGNRTIMIPSQTHPLVATDLYQVLETSDVPAGSINIVTGAWDELAAVLAAHDGVDALWHFGEGADYGELEAAASSNMKRTWGARGRAVDWFDDKACPARRLLRHAVEVKNIWIPYGD